MLIYRIVVLKLLAYRTLGSIGYFFKQKSLSACFLYLQFAEPYEIGGLRVIRVRQSHACFLRIGYICLSVRSGQYNSIEVVIVLVSVHGTIISVAVRQRKPLLQSLPLISGTCILHSYGGILRNLYSLCKLPADDSVTVGSDINFQRSKRRGHITSTRAKNPKGRRPEWNPCTGAYSASSSWPRSTLSSPP